MKTTRYIIKDLIFAIFCVVVITIPINALLFIERVAEANILLLVSTVFIGIYTIIKIASR